MKLFLQYLKQRWRGIIVGVLFCAIFAVTFALYHRPVEVENGEYVAIMCESGSGKTTLLNILAALDKPTEGA